MRFFYITLSILLSTLITNKALSSDFNETSLRLTIEAICSASGQVSIRFSNVSGQRLFVDPHFADASLFDAASQGMFLTDVVADARVQLKHKSEYQDLDYWTVFQPGQSVVHNIDFREYANLDTNKEYKAGISSTISVILDDGSVESIRLSSSLLSKYEDVQPSCFK